MAVTVGEAQAIRGFSLEIKLNENGRRIAHNPGVMPGSNRNHLRGHEFENAAIRVMNVDLTASEEAHVSVHTELSAHNELHMSGPPEARRIDSTLYAGSADAHDIETDAADFSAIRVFYGGNKSIDRTHRDLLQSWGKGTAAPLDCTPCASKSNITRAQGRGYRRSFQFIDRPSK